ncbi:MAG: hypothetical protein ACQEVA_06545 [Myxococcota bacterium]
MKFTATLLSMTLMAAATTCEGTTLGENEAGESTFLDDGRFEGERLTATGSIAVEPESETSFVVQRIRRNSEVSSFSDDVDKRLLAVHPDGRVDVALDVTGAEDIRMVFPQDRILVMAEYGGQDTLYLLDEHDYQLIDTVETQAHYHGTRLSPSGRFLAVAENDDEHAPIHVIDTVTLERVRIDHQGEWLEAMWTAKDDRLVGYVDHEDDDIELMHWWFDPNEFAGPRTERVDFESGDAPRVADDPVAFEQQPDQRRRLSGFKSDFLFSMTWITVDPTGEFASFPVRKVGEDGNFTYTLIVWRLDDGSIRQFEDTQGPAAFTPDGSTLVGHGVGEEDGARTLRVIDLESGDVHVERIPGIGSPSYFVTPDGNRVIVASTVWDDGGDMVLYDIDNLRATRTQRDSDTGSTDDLQIPRARFNQHFSAERALRMDEATANASRLENLEIDADDGPTVLEDIEGGLGEFVTRIAGGEIWMADEGLYRLDYLNGAHEEIEVAATPKHINLLPRRDLLIVDDADSASLLFVAPDERAVVGSAELPTEPMQ